MPEFNKTIQRQTNYELLRIIAILLISLMHGIRSAYGSPNILNSVSFVAINAIGNMGVTIFILISGYFGIRFRLSKLFTLWAIVLFYSLAIFTYNTLNLPPTSILDKEFIKSLYTALTPITSATWWFITSYTILFMLSPLLNKSTEHITRHQFKYLLVVLLFFYSASPTFLMHSLSDTPNGKCTENMILAYLIGRYIYIYGMPSIIKRHSLMIFLSCISLIFCVNYFIFDPLFMAKDHNLFIIIGALCIFSIFSNLRIQLAEANRLIIKAASYAFPIYILNIFLIDLLEFQYIGLRADNAFLLYYLIVQCEIIGISIIIEYIRNMIFSNPIKLIGKAIDDKTSSLIDKII